MKKLLLISLITFSVLFAANSFAESSGSTGYNSDSISPVAICHPFPECAEKNKKTESQILNFGCNPYPQCVDDDAKKALLEIMLYGCSPYPQCGDESVKTTSTDLTLFGCYPYSDCLNNRKQPVKQESKVSYLGCSPYPRCENQKLKSIV